MSGKIVAEVWDNGPAAGITGAALLVLLRLADAAGEDDRMAWESIGTLAAKTGTVKSTVNAVIQQLLAAGVLAAVDPEDAPKASKLYRSAVRRITPVSEWFGSPEIGPSENRTSPVSGLDEPDDVGLDSPVSGPNYKPLVASNSVEETSSLSPDGRDRPSRRRGWDAVPSRQPRRKSARAKAEAAAAADDDLDPEKAIWGPADDADLDRPESDAGLPRRRTRSFGPVENLARSFEIAGKERYAADRMVDKTPGAFNRGALSGQFATWMREEGVTRGQIVGMIETFWSDGFQRDLNRPAWMDFLAQRGDLVASQKRKTEVARVERDRHDPAAWD